ncbi:MAG: hypothetical protein KAJ19_16060, partial [Gammaproteobacteria bacterium]|nr:hypothetical protein [Gammaproteobacteria bacterium]
MNVTLDGVNQSTTDLYGSYCFTTNVTGVHTVIETDPASVFSTTPNTVNLDVTKGNSYEANFGDAYFGVNVSGYVYVDANKNGTRDAGETGVDLLPVVMMWNEQLVDYRFPNSSGFYKFTSLPPGNLTVMSAAAFYPSLVENTTAGSVDIAAVFGEEYRVDFGLYVPSMVGGWVLLDLGGEGGPFQLMFPLSGVEITLLNKTGVVNTTTTNEWGMYMFEVAPGNYTVVETDPDVSGLFSTSPNEVNVTVEPLNYTAAHFNDSMKFGAMIGYVYNDTNLNGVWEGESTIPGAEIRVYNGSTLVLSSLDAIAPPSLSFNPFGGGGFALNVSLLAHRVVDQGGYYAFMVAPGNYTVVEFDLPGYYSTSPNVIEHEVKPGMMFFGGSLDELFVSFGDVLISPSLTVVKEVYGADGFWHGDTTQIQIGETVEYRFTVTNTGTTNVTDIHVLDNIIGPISMPFSELGLGVGMSKTVSSGSAMSGYHENIVNVNGTYENRTVYVIDRASYAGVPAPSTKISVWKYVSRDPGGPWGEHVAVETGYPVYFKVVVRNTGDVPLGEVSIYDSQVGDILWNAYLDPGEELEEKYEWYDTFIAGTYTNWAYASGAWHDEQTVWTSTKDNASYTAFIPRIMVSVTKNVS